VHLSWLEDVVAAGGKVASVHLDATRATEGGEHELELRWRAVRRSLEDGGAPDDLVGTLEERVLARTGVPGEHGRSIFATQDAVLVDVVTPRAPLRDVGHYGPVPHLLPLVRALDEVVPHVLVLVDHEGADIRAVTSRTGETTEHEVEGGHDVLHKYGGGGWSHRRFQHRVQDSWERNADAVHADVEKVVRSTRPDVVLLAGDPYSRGLLREAASAELAPLLVDLDTGGRAEGVDEEALASAVSDALRHRRQEQMGEVLARFAQERGRDGLAVEGLGRTVEAVRAGAVETLLLADDPSSTDRLWTGEDPLQVGVTADEVLTLGATDPVEDRADAVLLRALVAQAAGVDLVQGDGGPAGGVGALLRFDTRPQQPGSAG
jgi:Bacterial archaeo-eukaryotic release factor family 2